MAFMRMMGVDSVEYHKQTVLQRSNDHPGLAVDYYTSRGETPLEWGGQGAARLGLTGSVTPEAYEALYGPGGATDPVLGTRLTSTSRPGMELVVAAHKSVAELGVVGYVEDMHSIMDAERDATLAYLERLTLDIGGRRGRDATPTPTSGLVYCHTRHATTRAGDPGPHDHVLIMNGVEMLDAKGGWKAPNTALWRDHLHAATIVGRMASAQKAVELGYGIVADDGPSGRLGHWAIAGVPQAAMAVHSKRSAEIDAHLAGTGHSGYTARTLAARETRAIKRHTPVERLLPGWRAELTEAGYPPGLLVSLIHNAARREPPAPHLTPRELQSMVEHLTGIEGPLAAKKVFCGRDIVVAAGPLLYGRARSELDRVVNAVIASAECVPLLTARHASQTARTLACVLATEHAIAATLEHAITRPRAAVVPADLVDTAIDRHEHAAGRPLTVGQRQTIRDVCASPAGAELIVGIAGSGKTTTIAVIAEAYTGAGFTVLGTATSGQAARTLGEGAGIESSTVASLLWRIEHHTVILDARTVVILDEAGMTDDPDLHRLLTACDLGHAKVLLVGDDRQLSAVGPGGALEALINRHPNAVHRLTTNVRQTTPGEADALNELRDGNLDTAVTWMADHDRIVTNPDRHELLDAAVDRWAADVTARRDTLLLAWRRADVEELNHRARDAMAGVGRLAGPELDAPGGNTYQAGDRVLGLAPQAGMRTSERGTVTHVDPDEQVLWVLPDGADRAVALTELGRDRLDYGYAITIHRAQGATVDTAHVLEDGGGRELAYVKTTRATDTTHLYVQADHVPQAVDDLQGSWAREQRQQWVTDTHQPHPAATDLTPTVPSAVADAARGMQLAAERWAVTRLAPPHPGSLREAYRERDLLAGEIDELRHGRGPHATAELRDRYHEREDAARQADNAEHRAGRPDLGWREHRRAVRDLAPALERADQAEADWQEALAPIETPLTEQLAQADARIARVNIDQAAREQWLHDHPDVRARLSYIDDQILKLLQPQERTIDLGYPQTVGRRGPAPDLDMGLGL